MLPDKQNGAPAVTTPPTTRSQEVTTPATDVAVIVGDDTAAVDQALARRERQAYAARVEPEIYSTIYCAQCGGEFRADDTLSRCTCEGNTQAASPAVSDDEPAFIDKLRLALVDSAGLDNIPVPESLVHSEILFRDSLVWTVGKPGHMKSFVKLDLAGCVGTGQSWQGNPVTQGTVLYLVAEGVRGMKKRVRAWEESMGSPMANVHFLPVAVQAMNVMQWTAFCQLAAELAPILIVVDTQARVTVGVKENDAAEMGVIVERLEQLRRATGACVDVVHHIGRTGDTGRGSTALDGAVSTIVKVTKDGDKVTLECQKNKDGAEWTPIELRAVPTGSSIVLVPHDGHSPTVTDHSAAMRTAVTWWEHHRDAWVSKSDLVDVIAARTTLYRHLSELIEIGAVEATETAKPNSPKKFRLRRQPSGASS